VPANCEAKWHPLSGCFVASPACTPEISILQHKMATETANRTQEPVPAGQALRCAGSAGDWACSPLSLAQLAALVNGVLGLQLAGMTAWAAQSFKATMNRGEGTA
jgi:hypothetical protein